jgi:hypothetical protein
VVRVQDSSPLTLTSPSLSLWVTRPKVVSNVDFCAVSRQPPEIRATRLRERSDRVSQALLVVQEKVREAVSCRQGETILLLTVSEPS